jgi:glc operon protein GlcG
VRPASFVAGALLALSPSVAAAQRPMATTTYIDSAQVAAAFAQGMPLVETSAYKIHASRREGPGKAEIHVRDTDVIYVLAGGATFVTGGTAIDPQTIAPDEVRGTRIEAGATQVLKPGDVIIVPNGTPHWFKEVRAPFLYYTIKITQSGGM